MRTPTYRELGEDECRAMLRRNTYGRLAFTDNDRVDVEPLHYVLEGDWLYIRTSPGTKVASLRHGPWVAFEVDEVRAPFDWASVVAKGTVYFIAGVPDPEHPDEYARAVEILRRIVPETMTPQDPAPWRTVLLRISVNELQGRASHPV